MKRIYGLDLIRILSFAAIFFHHFLWVGWYMIGNPLHDTAPVSRVWESLSRSLCFSGQSILMFSVFLIALKTLDLKKRVKLLSFLLVGWMLFSLLLIGGTPFWMEWDIYPLIVVGLGLMTLFEVWHARAVYVAGLLGFALLWIPFWEWPSLQSLSLLWRHILIGDCAMDVAEWPVLPWIGLIFSSYAAGYHFRNRKKKLESNSKFSFYELLVWLPLLAFSFRYLGNFYDIPLGDQFSCYIFRRPFVEMFFHLIWIVFLMRLSFVGKVQHYLAHNKINLWISSLAISRNFWLAYFIHYISLYIFVWPLRFVFLKYPHLADLELLAFPFFLEYLTRWGERLMIHVRNYAKNRNA